jgi:hypothetical protein
MQAYPLQWPPGVPRSTRREAGAFKTTLAGALKNVQDSLRKFGVDSRVGLGGVVLSSNCSLGVDKPQDPGVAVWFTWDGAQRCIAVDRYASPAANLQAIHHIIEARRVELRHGTLAMVRATFQGFTALAAPATARAWWEVLGVAKTATADEIRAAYRRLSSQHHPDKGGSHDAMTAVNAAYQRALEERP